MFTCPSTLSHHSCHVFLLTCSSVCLREISSWRFPSRFVQDVERVVDFRVRWGEGAQTADAADDGHMLVDQRRHPLAVQVTAVAVVTCHRRKSLEMSVFKNPSNQSIIKEKNIWTELMSTLRPFTKIFSSYSSCLVHNFTCMVSLQIPDQNLK